MTQLTEQQIREISEHVAEHVAERLQAQLDQHIAVQRVQCEAHHKLTADVRKTLYGNGTPGTVKETEQLKTHVKLLYTISVAAITGVVAAAIHTFFSKI